MAREIPEVVRAAAGLAATVLDEARRLPETLPGLPVRAIGLALQQAMRIQQHYAGLVARGDELLVGLRGEHEPGLATFDDDIDGDTGGDGDLADAGPATVITGYRESAFDRADIELAEVLVDEDGPDDTLAGAAPQAGTPAPGTTSTDSPRKKGKGKGKAKGGGTGSRKARSNLAEAAGAAEVAGLPADPAADAVVDAVEDVAAQVDGAQETLDDLPGDAPSTEEVLEELAIDEMVGDAPTTGAPAGGGTDLPADAPTADVLTPDGQVATVEAAVTDEGIAAPEAPVGSVAPEAPEAPVGTAAPDRDTGTSDDPALDESGTPVAAATGVRTDVGGPDTSDEDAARAAGAAVDAVGEDSPAPTDDPEGGSEVSGSQAAGVAPVEGYDGFSIAQLRGRLRGYALSTVADLLAYEEATRAREPYVRMLRNRLERLEAQAVEASPLAPRGA